MRFNVVAAALAAISLVAAQDVTSQSTVTITKTVERVVQTDYATRSSSSAPSSSAPALDTELPHEPVWSTTASSMPSSAPSAIMPMAYNGTTAAPSGTGSVPAPSVDVQPAGNAAPALSSSYAFAAIAGLVGLAVL